MPDLDPSAPGRLVMAVDGNSLVHRSFHAQANTGIRGADGRPIWAVRGLLAQLVTAVERLDPDVVVIGFDDPASSWRRDTWPGYKGTRGEKLDTLVGQLADAAAVLDRLGLRVVVPNGLEADDVLASTAASARARGDRTVVVSSDRDAFALIDDVTSVLRIINGGVEASPLLTPERLTTLLGIRAGQYLDFAALRGDASDNLPGVLGIGPKTAARLLTTFGSARDAFDDVAAGGNGVVAALGPGIAAKLGAHGARERYERNCAVMTMRCDVHVDLADNLPCAEQAVRTIFDAHQLTYSLPGALRSLARLEVPGPAPTRAFNTSGRTWSAAPRHPPLRKPTQSPQLALF